MNPPDKNDQRLKVTPDSVEAIFKQPMVAVPKELRPAAIRVWMLNKHLVGMESPLAIAVSLATWIDEWGLTVADAQDVLRELTHPKNMGDIKFASDLVSRMAEMCGRKMETRKSVNVDIARFL